MGPFLKIYGLILIMGIISTTVDKVVLKKERKFLSTSLMYSVIYYITVAFGRTVVGSGDNYLSYSFYGKEFRGYIKVLILLIAVYLLHCMLAHLFKEKYLRWIQDTVGFFSIISSLYIVLWDQLRLNIVCGMAVLSALAALIYWFIDKDDKKYFMDDKRIFQYLTVQLVLFSIMHFIVGPAEIYAFNQDDFVYSYRIILPNLLLGTIVFIGTYTVLIGSFAPKKFCKITCITISAYNILGYIQSFLLNGKMTSLDGSEQQWGLNKQILNACIWLLIVFIVLILCRKLVCVKKAIIIVSIYIVLIQTVTYIYLFASKHILADNNSYQVVEEGVLELASENIIVFILDAYDTQEIQMVLADDANYLVPLKDFTYFNNMSSRYYYTDFSLPFLFTGGDKDNLDVSDKTETYQWYDDDCFLRDIDDYGYDIRVLTEKKYVDKFGEVNPVKNYSEGAYCVLDTEKTMALFADSIRYRNMPLCLKGFYRYGIYDFEDVASRTNIYRIGTDEKFDDMVLEQGLGNYGSERAFRFYHMYGAHAPYPKAGPISQFEFALRMVYDYLDELKKADLYDDATIIITADHGLNPGQVDALRTAGVECDETRSNPIFFIKKKGESHKELLTDSKSVSLDQFFDTIMTCIDKEWENKYYGTIWD